MAEGNQYQWKFSLYWKDPKQDELHFLGSSEFGKDHDAEKIKEVLLNNFWTQDLTDKGYIPVVKEADA